MAQYVASSTAPGTKLIKFNSKHNNNIIGTILYYCNVDFEHFLLAIKYYSYDYNAFTSSIFENVMVSDEIKEKVVDNFIKNEVFK